jgi:hypothetical protein
VTLPVRRDSVRVGNVLVAFVVSLLFVLGLVGEDDGSWTDRSA